MRSRRIYSLMVIFLVIEIACTPPKASITSTSAGGMEVRAIPYGGIITSIRAPDRDGRFDDVVPGYDDPGCYITNNPPYRREILGPYCNRIAKGMCTRDRQ